MQMRIFAVIALASFPVISMSQVNKLIERQSPVVLAQRPDVHNVFQRVEKGLATSSVQLFSSHLGSQILVSIRGRDDGYFSRNQTASVLQNYFVTIKPVSFAFSKLQEAGENPYATGRLTYVNKGNQEFLQIYVSLSFHDSKWVISQFNIY